jgi:hypothetical protein
VSRYHPTLNKVYGLTRINKTTLFVMIPQDSSKPEVIKQFKEIGNVIGTGATIDTDNNRFIFWGRVKKIFNLYVLDIHSGNVLHKYVPEKFFTEFAYNPMSGNIVTIIGKKGKGQWIEMNIATGKHKRLASIPGFTRLHSSSFYIDSQNKRILALAKINNIPKLLVFHQATKILSIKETTYVNLDRYKVVRFNKTNKSLNLSTSYVQACIGVAGYSSKTRTGFLTHISPRNKKIPQLLNTIDNELKKQKSNGLKDMRIEIFGGIKTQPNSYENVITLYNELQNTYGIKLSSLRKHHIGKSYNAILTAGKIHIF